LKQKIYLIGIVILLTLVLNTCYRQSDFPILKGPYLGQKPPGLKPEVFAPGIISGSDHEGCAEFTKNGTLFLFQRLPHTEASPTDIPVFIMELKDGKWTELRPAPFESPYLDWDYHFTPNGRILYFTSKRPAIIEGKSSLNPNIWMTEITPDGWTQPRLLPYPINTAESSEQTPSVTREGTLYFFSSRYGGYGKCDIYRAKEISGSLVQVENLGNVINTEHDEYDLFVAPDESYLIFSSDRPGGFGSVDLYISFRKVDGTWTEPKNMGKNINSGGAVFPSVTDDGRFLFFQSGRGGNGDIYWVDARIIEEMKQDPMICRR
jgi:Tol biopolymer transport system component